MRARFERWVGRQPIARKLSLAVLATGATSIVLACGVFAADDYRQSRAALVERITSAADIAADNVAAEVAFQDASAARQTLAGLTHSRVVASARVFLPDGVEFAAWSRGSDASTDRHGRSAAAPATGAKEPTQLLLIRRPVLFQDEQVATIVVEADTTVIWERLRRFGLTMLLVLVATISLAVAFSREAARITCDPIERLIRLTRELRATRNYGLRAESTTKDEVGELVASFNDMLDEIHTRDTALVLQQRTLEQTVEARTSALREANDALVETRDRALDASRAKGEFLANMSHEIRTPMNGVIGMTEILLESDLNDDQRECADTIRRSADALLCIINDILDFSKIEAGKLTITNAPFDLQQAVDECIEPLATLAARKDIELIVSFEAPARVIGDSGRIRQIVTNLAANAIKFTERGYVLVRVGCEPGNDGTGHFEVAVEDTGIGIPAAALPTLFQKFTQVDSSSTRRHGGTGLGLAISRQLALLMGGSLSATSEVGRGSTFKLTLPLRLDPAADEASPSPDLSRLRVLVVDDHGVNRTVIQRQLARYGIRVDAAATGAEALQRLRQASAAGDAFDLAILDHQMPGMDGCEVGAAIKADPAVSDTILLMLSSTGRHIEIDAGVFAARLSKPARQTDLRRAIDDLTARSPKRSRVEDRTPLAGPPTAPAPRHDPREATTTAGPTATQGLRALRVLVVEDNAVNQAVAVRLLNKLGCRVDLAVNGVEAVDRAADVSYDVILMDCQMPVMDGYEAARSIRKSGGPRQAVPIIAMTAHAMAGDRQRCLDAGMSDYLAKPVTVTALRGMLERWVPSGAAPAV